MAFKKGKSGNPAGREKGSINEKTKIWNEIGEVLSGATLEIYMSNLKYLMISEDAKIKAEGMKRYETILEFFKPKLARTEVKQEQISETIISFKD